MVKKRVVLVVASTLTLASVVLVWLALRPSRGPDIERLFLAESGDWPEWPPQSNADLESALATTAARRIGAAGMLQEFDAGATSPVPPGLLVRTGYAEGLYYIEAVIGRDARFDDRMPMAVLIHGRGDRARIPGGPFWGLGAPIRVIVPQAPDPLGQGFEWLPVRVGQNLVDRLTTSLLERAGQLAAMLKELTEALPTVGRPMIVGFSQGGLLTLTLALHHSDVVQAAFPLAAWLPPALVPPYSRADIVHPRVRGLHGADDRIIAVGPTAELFGRLRARGFDADLETFEDAGHEMTDAMNRRLHELLREEMGLVVAAGIRAGILDGGAPPCLPLGEWPSMDAPDGGWPEAGPPIGGWLASQRPEAGWPEGGWAEALRPEAGWPDDDVPPWTPCEEPRDGGDGLDDTRAGPRDAGVE